MKYYFTLLSVSFLIIIASSCKKNGTDLLSTPVEIDTLTTNGYKFNYFSMQINGKTYMFNVADGGLGWGNMPVNRKREPLGTNGEIRLNNGDADSVLFWRKYTLSPNSTFYMDVLFCKKFAKKDCSKDQMGFYYPIDKQALFKTGLQGFATDFERENSYSGIGIWLRLKEDDKQVTYSTYSLQYPHKPTSINNDSQKESYFDIVKVASAKHRLYLEAKFKAKAFNLNEDVVTIDKGFIRLQIN